MMLQNKLTRSILLTCGISALAACGGGSSSGSSPAAVPKHLVINASTTGSNHSLWTTDGTAKGTKTLNSTDVYYRGQTYVNGKVYFISNATFGGSVYNNYVWFSDGTNTGPVKDTDDNPIALGTVHSSHTGERFAILNNKAYIVANDRKLYEINGSKATAVADFSASNISSLGGPTGITRPQKPFSDGKYLYVSLQFARSSGSGTAYFYHPYRVNTSLSTAHKLERVNNSGSNITEQYPESVYRSNGQTFWHMGGSAYKMGDAIDSLSQLQPVVSIDKLLQLGDGSLMAYGAFAKTFHVVSSTGVSTLTLDASSISGWDTAHIQFPPYNKPNIIGNNKLYFLYGSTAPYDMISIDKNGTVSKLSYGSEITNLIPDATSASKLNSLAASHQAWRVNSHIVFPAFAETSSNIGNELWTIDEAAGTVDITKDIHNVNNTHLSSGSRLDSDPNILGIINNKVIFDAFGGNGGTDPSGKELWSSDGTTSGTRMIKDIASGSLNGVNNKITF